MGVILIGGSRRPLIPRSDGVEPSSASATFGAWGRVHASGQVQAEYALVVAAIAIGCIVAVLFVGGALSGLFDSSARPLTAGRGRSRRRVLPPPTPRPSAQCENGGWESFPQFQSEAACVDYVAA